MIKQFLFWQIFLTKLTLGSLTALGRIGDKPEVGQEILLLHRFFIRLRLGVNLHSVTSDNVGNSLVSGENVVAELAAEHLKIKIKNGGNQLYIEHLRHGPFLYEYCSQLVI